MRKYEENNSINSKGHGEKKMETWLKFTIALCGFASVGVLIYGINTYQHAKELEIKQASVVVNAGDISEEVQAEKEKDRTKNYIEEAESLWSEYQEEVSCDKDVFKSKYVFYRGVEYTKKEALYTVLKEYKKPIETSEVEPLFTVEDYEEVKMYAMEATELRNGPSIEYMELEKLSLNDEVVINGLVKSYKGEECLWYRLITGEFINASCVSEKPIVVIETANKEPENKEPENKEPEPTTAPVVEEPEPAVDEPVIDEPVINDPEPVIDEPVVGIHPETGEPVKPGDKYYLDGWGEIEIVGEI